jgi:hypothetical protein
VIQAKSSSSETATINKFLSCEAKRIQEAFLVRGQGVTANFYEDCRSFGDPADPIQKSHGKVLIESGPKYNYFRRLRISNAKFGVAFAYATNADFSAAETSDSNSFDNCIFENLETAFVLDWWESGALVREVLNTQFLNCTFVNGTNFIQQNRSGAGNVLVNCIVKNFGQYLTSTPGKTVYPHGFSFDHCCLDNNSGAGFPTEAALPPGNLEEDPLMTSTFPYDLYPGNPGDPSPCVDAGIPPGTGFIDFNGTPRPQRSGFDIGAQEVP